MQRDLSGPADWSSSKEIDQRRKGRGGKKRGGREECVKGSSRKSEKLTHSPGWK